MKITHLINYIYIEKFKPNEKPLNVSTKHLGYLQVITILFTGKNAELRMLYGLVVDDVTPNSRMKYTKNFEGQKSFSKFKY